jgi:hypothetical protein
MTMSETWQPSQMGNHAMHHVKIESIEWIETGGNSCVRDIRFNHADISNSTHENENSWQSVLVQASFQTSIAFRVSGRWRHWWCSQSHEFKRAQHTKIACYVIRVTKLWQTGCPHRRPSSFLPFFVPFRQSSVGERAIFCTFLDWRYRNTVR